MRRNHYLILGFGLLLLILGLVAVVGEGGGLREREVVFWGEGDKWSAQSKRNGPGWPQVGGRQAGPGSGGSSATRGMIQRVSARWNTI